MVEHALEAARLARNRRLMAVGFISLGIAHIDNWQYEQALNVFETGLAQGCVGGNSRMMGVLLTNLGRCYLSQGKLNQALTNFNQALNINHRSFDLPGETAIRYRMSQSDKCAGRLEQARLTFSEVLSEQENLHLERWQTLTLSMLAYLELWSGRLEPAGQFTKKAEAMARRLAFPNLGAILTLKGRVLMAIGNYGEAEQVLDEAGRLLENLYQQPHDAPYLTAAQIDLALAQGRPDDAAKLAVPLLPGLKLLDYDVKDDPFTVYLAVYRALRASGDRRATEVLNAARQELGRLGENIPETFVKDDLLNIPARAKLNEMIRKPI
jgi:tetratricopeptide (TPR) repeat protein